MEIITKEDIERVSQPDKFVQRVQSRIRLDREWARKLFIEMLKKDFPEIPEDAELKIICSNTTYIQWNTVTKELTKEEYTEHNKKKKELKITKRKENVHYEDEDEEEDIDD